MPTTFNRKERKTTRRRNLGARPYAEARNRITARVPKAMQAVLQEAAELTGATVNQFVVQTAYEHAQRLLERESLIRLSQQDARRIFELLETPPKPTRQLKDAVKTFKRSVRA